MYDYHPGAETLLMRHFSGPDSNLPVNPDGTLVFPSHPRAGGMLNRHRPGHRSPMPERLIWSYIIQLSSALRSVHASGLACRVIDSFHKRKGITSQSVGWSVSQSARQTVHQ